MKTMKGADIAHLVKEQLTELTGLKAGTVSGLMKDGEAWDVTLEMIELSRIPSAQDVLATYSCNVDLQGNLVSYKRTRRYLRGAAEVMEAE